MKTTLDIPDDLLRQVKARAALSRQSMRVFFIDALHQKIAAEQKSKASKPVGWRAVFGKGSETAVAELQAVLDDEFAKINPGEWT